MKKRTPVSICVIMKNEEKHIRPFLSAIRKSFKDYPYELNLVDTGSTDRTKEIAEEFTDRIFDFQWINDFSAARNYSLSCASGDWILVLDCDEFVTDLDPRGFETFMEKYPRCVGMLSRQNHYEMNGTDSIYTDDVERFFNRKLFHYESIIHEQVRALDGSKYTEVALPLTVNHLGYTGSREDLERKVTRNNELLLKMLKESPDDPYLYFQLGQSFNMIHNDEKACYYYGKGLEYDLDPKLEYVQMMVIGYGYALLHLNRFKEALQFQNIYDEFATTADFICLMGLIYLRNGMVLEAMKEFLKATACEKANTSGANTFIPLFNMGCINEVLGNLSDAKALYQKCGDFKPALDRLKELKI